MHDLDITAIRQSHPLPAVIGQTVKLRRAGNELIGCCPFHNDRSPSFTVFNGGQRFHCFGCGASGDVLDFVGRLHNVKLPEAAAMLTGNRLPVVQSRPLPPPDDRDRVAEARAVWRSAGPIQGTPAEAYLRRRGITIALPASLRFARLTFGKTKDLPAMVAVFADADDRLSGVQRTFLTEDGRKADLPGGKVRFSLGRIKGGACRLAPGAASGLIVCEGVEDGLSLLQMQGQAVWAAAGAGMLEGMRLPLGVRSVIIGADADDAGRAAAAKAADAFKAEGREARIIYPLDPHKDFNQELMEGSA